MSIWKGMTAAGGKAPKVDLFFTRHPSHFPSYVLTSSTSDRWKCYAIYTYHYSHSVLEKPFLNTFVLALKHYTVVSKLKGCLLHNKINFAFSGYSEIFLLLFLLHIIKFNFFTGWYFTFPKINTMKDKLVSYK